MSAEAKLTAPAPSVPAPRVWDGRESAWLQAAWAAAPWPLWALVAFVGVPGGALVPPWIHGPLALSVMLAAMVVWVHRPSWRSVGRWVPSIVGTGLMAELLASALTDMGDAEGFAALTDPARGLATWLVAVTIYEVSPIVAASSRVSPAERRERALDVLAHAVFVLLAALAYRFDPVHGDLWKMSPWIAGAIALPLAAARCGPIKAASAPSGQPRGGVFWGLALIAWGLAAAMAIASADALRDSMYTMRWGVPAATGVLLLLPTLSGVLALAAAISRLRRATQLRGAPSGIVTDRGERTVTLSVDGTEDPIVVTLEGALPEEGATVTLLGALRGAPDGGPFRDASSWRARRAWPGRPAPLARGLVQSAGAWVAWAGLSAVGLLMLLW